MASIPNKILRMPNSKALSKSSIKTLQSLSGVQICSFSTTSTNNDKKNYKLLVVGGGCGGLATASMFSKKLGKGNVAVVEPNEIHNYQPLWTLVGAGLKKFEKSQRPQGSVMPKNVDWIKDKAAQFDPDRNVVITANGDEITYDYLVVAMGLQLDYHKIKGAVEALQSDPQVCSNYSPIYVKKTFPAIQAVNGGNMIFTYPNSPVKCAGAPQKIMYLADDIMRRAGKRDQVNIHYYTSLPAIFGIKKYAEALMKVVQARNLNLTTRTHLIEIKSDTKEAVFENLDTQEQTTVPYAFLHVSPPMSTPEPLRSSALVDPASGFVTVTRETLQHTKYDNVFAIGDNANTPNAKTAAAIAAQTGALKANLTAVMEKRATGEKPYQGYASCPLITSKDKCILAEFDWNGQPMETFPVNQARESRFMYQCKATFMPTLYWDYLIKGTWRGPAIFRKIFHFGRV